MAGLKGKIVVEFTNASATTVRMLTAAIEEQFRRVVADTPIKWEITEITAAKEVEK